MWCALWESEIIGPHFFENENVTGSTYKRVLRHSLFPKLRGYPEDMIFEQEGALPHYSLEDRKYADRKLPGWWMRRGGPIDLPARSPELTPCDYSLRSNVKDLLYRDPPRTISELKSKIRSAIATINEGTLQEVFRNMRTRLGFVVREQGGAFEHLMNLKSYFYVFPISIKKFSEKNHIQRK